MEYWMPILPVNSKIFFFLFSLPQALFMCLCSLWFSQVFLEGKNSKNSLCKKLKSLLRIKLTFWPFLKYSNITIFLVIGALGIILESLCTNSRVVHMKDVTSRNPYAVVSCELLYYFFRFLHITWSYQWIYIPIFGQTTFSWAPKPFIREVAKISPDPLTNNSILNF